MSQKKATREMHDETCLEKRGTVYYFRMKVPADLRKHLKKNEVRLSLQTKDKPTAKRLASEHKAAQLRKWEDHRALLKNGPRRSITQEEIQRIAAHSTAHLLAFDEEERMRGRPLNRDQPSQPAGEMIAERDHAAIAEGRYSESLHLAAEDWLREYGYELSRDSDDYVRFI